MSYNVLSSFMEKYNGSLKSVDQHCLIEFRRFDFAVTSTVILGPVITRYETKDPTSRSSNQLMIGILLLQLVQLLKNSGKIRKQKCCLVTDCPALVGGDFI